MRRRTDSSAGPTKGDSAAAAWAATAGGASLSSHDAAAGASAESGKSDIGRSSKSASSTSGMADDDIWEAELADAQTPGAETRREGGRPGSGAAASGSGTGPRAAGGGIGAGFTPLVETEPVAERILAATPSWLVSLIVHVVVLLILALMTVQVQRPSFLDDLTFGTAESDGEQPDFANDLAQEAIEIDAPQIETPSPPTAAEAVSELPALADAPVLESLREFSAIDPLGQTPMELNVLPGAASANIANALTGRNDAEKIRLLREGGGTEGSEKAVEMALAWFKNHQNGDGSWSLKLLYGACNCPNPGIRDDANIAATALALLPFLGAGHTHERGAYRQEVQAGLYYLLARQQSNGSLWEPGGQMYSHGLASIALCEAYAMTRDKALARPAQGALNFIGYAQDPVGGGWRYQVREPGDTSVVGWQLMALKSGHMAYLDVHPNTLAGAARFLDSVQTDQGSGYGYKDPGDKPSTSAIGLLCRMYLGWKRDEPALVRGVERLSRTGPSENDMYYNYYATQVMRHFGGEPWEKWNQQMRDWLVEKQARRGHQAGSWHMGENHSADVGGRLYSTSMATMILEVYYRHLPIYRQQAVEDEFEL